MFDYTDEAELQPGEVSTTDYHSITTVVPEAEDGYVFIGWEAIEPSDETDGEIEEDDDLVFQAKFEQIAETESAKTGDNNKPLFIVLGVVVVVAAATVGVVIYKNKKDNKKPKKRK